MVVSAPHEPPNIPRDLKDVKRAFVPKLDCYLFADYKNIEVRLLAYYLSGGIGDDEMAKQFRTDPNYDPHQETADMVGIDRQAGKTLNFSIIYGGGTPTLMRQLGIPYREAKRMLDGFHEARPGIKLLNDELQNAILEKGYVRSIYGRRHHVQDGHKVLNHLIQGTAADLMKRSIVNTHRWLRDEAFNSHIVNIIHDELMLDCSKDEVYAVAEEVPSLMIDPKIDRIVPITVDLEISYTNWADKVEYA